MKKLGLIRALLFTALFGLSLLHPNKAFAAVPRPYLSLSLISRFNEGFEKVVTNTYDSVLNIPQQGQVLAATTSNQANSFGRWVSGLFRSVKNGSNKLKANVAGFFSGIQKKLNLVGLRGPRGYRGPRGFRGPGGGTSVAQDLAFFVGAKGDAGVAGATGATGATGSTGPAADPGGEFIVRNGNSFAAEMVIGTNDNYALILETNNTERLRIANGGSVTIAGDLIGIRGISYSWPSSQGAASSILTNDGAGTLSWGTLAAASISDDSLDFNKFEDTLDLDAALVLNQTTNTWSQTYTGTSGAGFTYTASGAVTSGNAAAFDINVSNASTSVPAVMITNAGGTRALVINDDGTTTDTTPFTIHHDGNVGIGVAGATEKLDINGNILLSSTATPVIKSNGTLAFRIDADSDTADGNTSFVFQENLGAELMRLTDVGNLGIGTTDPAYKTEIKGTQAAPSTSSTPNGIFTISEAGNQVLNFGISLTGLNSWIQSRDATAATYYALALNPSGGNVGIGTTGPTYKLHLLDTAANQPSVFVENTSTFHVKLGLTSGNIGIVGSTNATPLQLITNNTNRIHIDTSGNIGIGTTTTSGGALSIMSGNVGIGTTSPGQKLQVGATTDSTANIIRIANGSGTDALSILSFLRSGAIETVLAQNGSNFQFAVNPASYSSANITAAAKFTIDNAGNVGIGTTTAGSKLTIQSDNISQNVVNIDGDTSVKDVLIRFTDNSAQKAWIGIAKTNSVITGAADNDLILRSEGANIDFTASSGGDPIQMRLTAAGNVGIGTTGPSQTLHVAGTARITTSTAVTDDRTLCTIAASGEIEFVNGACGTSSRRYKENIKPLEYGLEDIAKLNPVFFNYKKDSGASSDLSLIDDRTKRRIGFIAEEMNEIIPEVVIWQNGQIESIDNAYLTSLAIKGIQELDAKVEKYNDESNKILSKLSIDENGNLILPESARVGQSSEDETDLESVLSRIENLESQQKSPELKEKVDKLAAEVDLLKGQVLSASTSALLSDADYILNNQETNNKIQTSSSSANLKDQTILENLIVTGKTNVYDLAVTGTMNVGTMFFDGLKGEIQSLGDELKLSVQGASVVIDSKGNLTTNKLNIATPDPEAASIGEAIFRAGESEIVVKTKSVSDKSRIFTSPTTETAIPLAIIKKTAGESFTVKLAAPAPRDISFDWWVVN